MRTSGSQNLAMLGTAWDVLYAGRHPYCVRLEPTFPARHPFKTRDGIGDKVKDGVDQVQRTALTLPNPALT